MRFEYYFHTTKGHFWRWDSDSGEDYIVLYNGHTIAHRDLIVKVLKEFSGQEFPPFEAILMALAATNKHGNENVNALSEFFNQTKSKLFPMTKYHSDLVAFLVKLTQLPDVYRTGHKRIQMLLAIFENSHNSTHQIPGMNIKEKTFDISVLKRTTQSQSVIFRGIRSIVKLNDRFPTVESIIQHTEKSLNVIIDFNLENPVGDLPSNEEFIQELSSTKQTKFISSLIPNIWAGLHIPSNTQLPDQQSMGGVADISNKGKFDQLLISEFANNDDVFLFRLANNEALYLEKEVPPNNLENNKTILIDVSIKNWGTPKQIAYAIQIALTKKDNEQTYQSFAVGEKVAPIKTDTISQFVNSLNHVSSAANAKKGLDQFFKNYKESTSEIIFISRKEIVESADFQKVMTNHRSFIKYIITVEPDGQVDLYHLSSHTKRHAQGFKLDVSEKKDNKPPIQDKPLPYDIQLLFKNPSNLKYVGHTETLLVLVSYAGNIFTKKLGSFTGLKYLPVQPISSNIFETLSNDEGEFLAFFNSKGHFILLNLTTLQKESIGNPGWTVSEIFLSKKENFFVLTSIDTTWHITPNGIFTTHKTKLNQTELQTTMKKASAKLTTRIKKNKTKAATKQQLERAFATTPNRLIINNHALSTKNGDLVFIHVDTENLKKQHSATTKANKLVFNNGYEIHLLSEGMLILRFKNVHTIHFTDKLPSGKALKPLNRYSTDLTMDYKRGGLITPILTSDQQLKYFRKPYREARIDLTTTKHDFYDVFIHAVFDTPTSAASRDLFVGNPTYKDPNKEQTTTNASKFLALIINPFIKAIRHET